MEDIMYPPQSLPIPSTGEVKLISSLSHTPLHKERSHKAVLKLAGSLQAEIPGVEKNLLALLILDIPPVSICIPLLSGLGLQQLFVNLLAKLGPLLHSLLSLLHPAESIQVVHRHQQLLPIGDIGRGHPSAVIHCSIDCQLHCW